MRVLQKLKHTCQSRARGILTLHIGAFNFQRSEIVTRIKAYPKTLELENGQTKSKRQSHNHDKEKWEGLGDRSIHD